MTIEILSRLRTHKNNTPSWQRLHATQTDYLLYLFKSPQALLDFETALTDYENLLYEPLLSQENAANLLNLPSNRKHELLKIDLPISSLLTAGNFILDLQEVVNTLQKMLNHQQRLQRIFGKRIANFLGIKSMPRSVALRFNKLNSQVNNEQAILANVMAQQLQAWSQAEKPFITERAFFKSLHTIDHLLQSLATRNRNSIWGSSIAKTVDATLNTITAFIEPQAIPKLMEDSQSWFKGRRTRAQLIYQRALLQYDIAKARQEHDPVKQQQLLAACYQKALLQVNQSLQSLNHFFHKQAKLACKMWRTEIQLQLAEATTNSLLITTSAESAQQDACDDHELSSVSEQSENAKIYEAMQQALQSLRNNTLLSLNLTRQQVSALIDYSDSEIVESERSEILATLTTLSSSEKLNRTLQAQLDLLLVVFSRDSHTAHRQQQAEHYFTKISVSVLTQPVITQPENKVSPKPEAKSVFATLFSIRK